MRIFLLLIRLVPIKNATDKRRDQSCLRLRASNSLIEVEEQRHVALHALLFQDLSCLNPLPCRRNLDQNPFLGHSLLGIKSNGLVSFGDGSLNIEGKTGVDFSAHISRHDLGDLGTEGYSQPVRGVRNLLLQRCSLGVLDRLIDKRAVLGVAHRGKDEGRVCSRIFRLEASNAVQISCVGNNLGHLGELLSARWHVGLKMLLGIFS
mmetsp:Transcript_22398/g.50478  ORF Transcript_22398/g.50478 Transcript_22398/m.50478 type:complete len:206 (+) Transcript_22398:411-1028(+)